MDGAVDEVIIFMLALGFEITDRQCDELILKCSNESN